MPQRFFLEQYERHRRQGLVCYRSGDVAEARYQFLKASEFLYKLARESKGPLREARVAGARKLAELGRKLKKPPKKEAPATAVPAPASVRFDQIAGLEDVKEEIRTKMIYPAQHPEKAKKYRVKGGGGILLYGPPGTGKTLIARAVAAELDAPFTAISPSDILSKWVGESEKAVQGLFQKAREAPRAVIFIDEVEALTPRRRDTQEGSVMQRVVPQLLAALDGFDQGGTLLFVGATNEPWSIDGAILRPGRLDEKIYVGLPDAPARRRILELNLQDVPLADDVKLAALADRLDGYSGADIAYLCRKVCEEAFRRAVGGADQAPDAAAFASVLEWLRPSVRPEELARFEQFRKTGK